MDTGGVFILFYAFVRRGWDPTASDHVARWRQAGSDPVDLVGAELVDHRSEDAPTPARIFRTHLYASLRRISVNVS